MRARLIAAGVALALVSALSAQAATRGDPFEAFNRGQFNLQQALERRFLAPLASIFRHLTPGPIGKAIHNILVNLSEPVVVMNDMLQIRPARAGAASIRFVVNSTAGLAGMIDVVGKTGVPHRPSSFGDTLGRYGVGPGPYLFLPMIGPSTVRDLFGNIVDAVADPVHFARYPYRQQVSIYLAVAGGLDQLASSESDLRSLLAGATDPYATLRSTYLQHRQAEISGEAFAPAALPDLDDPEL
ncbi:MAG TPA: VacJ family lipoprotein, partial [Caulobacteraceae bacterium]